MNVVSNAGAAVARHAQASGAAAMRFGAAPSSLKLPLIGVGVVAGGVTAATLTSLAMPNYEVDESNDKRAAQEAERKLNASYSDPSTTAIERDELEGASYHSVGKRPGGPTAFTAIGVVALGALMLGAGRSTRAAAIGAGLAGAGGAALAATTGVGIAREIKMNRLV